MRRANPGSGHLQATSQASCGSCPTMATTRATPSLGDYPSAADSLPCDKPTERESTRVIATDQPLSQPRRPANRHLSRSMRRFNEHAIATCQVSASGSYACHSDESTPLLSLPAPPRRRAKPWFPRRRPEQSDVPMRDKRQPSRQANRSIAGTARLTDPSQAAAMRLAHRDHVGPWRLTRTITARATNRPVADHREATSRSEPARFHATSQATAFHIEPPRRAAPLLP